jgi:tetratricopeptide (TPR) repeat protein
LQAKAYYGLGRIAALEKDPELAEKLFQRTLETSPDPQVKAYSLLYLGRLADLAGEREQASRYYQGALAVEGAPAGARKAAEQGLKESFKKGK